MAKVEMTIDSLRQDLLHYEWILLLKDKVKERYLPICIGSPQADIIKRLFSSIERTEFTDYNLTVEGIDINDAELKSVIISGFKNNVFHAKLLLKRNNITSKVDCPPAKAVAIAIISGVSILQRRSS